MLSSDNFTLLFNQYTESLDKMQTVYKFFNYYMTLLNVNK